MCSVRVMVKSMEQYEPRLELTLLPPCGADGMYCVCCRGLCIESPPYSLDSPLLPRHLERIAHGVCLRSIVIARRAFNRWIHDEGRHIHEDSFQAVCPQLQLLKLGRNGKYGALVILDCLSDG